jgi:UDP-glucose 4-epimerase
MPTIGITGATGFIGGALVRSLDTAGFSLRLLDNRSGPLEVVSTAQPVERVAFESDEGLALLGDSDAILHLAAVSGVMACASDPQGSARTNVAGTARLAAMCRDRRIPLAFASSLAVVGAPTEFPVRETTPARPTHEYARQKAAGEALVASLGQSGEVATAVVRQSNVYGGYRLEGRYFAKGNVIQLFAQQAQTGRLAVNSPGTQRRDFVHIEDVVAHWEAIARYLLRRDAPRTSRTFNVASGEAFNVLEIAHLVSLEWHRLHPERPELEVDIVPNPRGGVELIEPEFTVSREVTERDLGIRCRWSVQMALPEILGQTIPE